ncbi:unnamed protein product [Pleuronectes platessa]|uniref:Uncharacterized protein n=1 Tax=Pleuronectes platessa TaxID=8262 RepID=A0A9N7TKV8_PLEPL|nr:unnamed protein product [Pleuronectes platessa]
MSPCVRAAAAVAICQSSTPPWTFKVIQEVLDVVEVRALCGPVKFFHTKLTQPCLYGPCFVHWSRVVLEQKRGFPKRFPQSWKHGIDQNVSGKIHLELTKKTS